MMTNGERQIKEQAKEALKRFYEEQQKMVENG
jgi:hypothetical protein